MLPDAQGGGGADPLHDREAERVLLERAKGGCPQAQTTLLDTFASRVELVARRNHHDPWMRQDLLQEGRIGLLEAVDHFDLQQGVRFWTYARWWVQARVGAHASRNRRIVTSSSRGYRRALHNLTKAERRLRQRNGGLEPERAALADDLGLSEEELTRITSLLRGYDASYDEQGTGAVSVAPDASPEMKAAEDECRALRQRMLARALAGLDRREREIVEARHLQPEPLTLRQLGERLGVSRERVRQLEGRALDKMRAAITEQTSTDEAMELAG